MSDPALDPAAPEPAAGEGTVRSVTDDAGMQHVANVAGFPTGEYDLPDDVMARSPPEMAQAVVSHIEMADDGYTPHG